MRKLPLSTERLLEQQMSVRCSQKTYIFGDARLWRETAMMPQALPAATSIIRKTKRFAIPERAVYFLKTKRTAGGTPPPQNIFDRLTPVFTIMQERSPDTIRTPFFSFCRFAPAFRASRYAASLNALYAATLRALTSLPRKARREPTCADAFEASPLAFALETPPLASA